MVRWVIVLFICLAYLNVNQALPQGQPCIQEGVNCLTAPHGCCDGLRCDIGTYLCVPDSGPVPIQTTTLPGPHKSSSSALYHHVGLLVLPSLLFLRTCLTI